MAPAHVSPGLQQRLVPQGLVPCGQQMPRCDLRSTWQVWKGLQQLLVPQCFHPPMVEHLRRGKQRV